MPNLNITPQSVLLTAGQSVTFVATDSENKPVAVSWNLNTPTGGGTLSAAPAGAAAAPPDPAVPPLARRSAFSAVYVAPSAVTAASTVAVIATSATDSVSATVAITPNAISIVPAKADLHVGQKQQFIAMVASALPNEPVIWNLSPPVGTLDQNGLYTAPEDAPEASTLTVIAANQRLGQQAAATITLEAKPWRGIGTNLLAVYLFLVFCGVFSIIALWPQQVPNLESLRADRLQAESTLQDKEAKLQAAMTTASKPANPTATPQTPAPPPSSTDATKTTDAAKSAASAPTLTELQKDVDAAQQDRDVLRKQLADATAPDVDTKLVHPINREIDLILLVLLAGSIGSFLHIAQSFSDFAGNRTLKASWVWWYSFQPFIGAGLALVLYAALRGGLITAGTEPTAKASDLNPFALVAAAALAGMFSKAATTKLGDVFETLFQASKGQVTKDKLAPPAPAAGVQVTPGTTTDAGTTPAATAPK